MNPDIREKVLKEAKRVSKQIIILDYTIPSPMNVKGINSLFYEFVAGYVQQLLAIPLMSIWYHAPQILRMPTMRSMLPEPIGCLHDLCN